MIIIYKVIWPVKTFDRYKLAGPDEIIPTKLLFIMQLGKRI